MKKFILTLFVWIIVGGVSLAADLNITLIRRIYIEILGFPPTPEEIDWYIVYNPDNSYELALKTLLKEKTNSEVYKYYSSQEYKVKERTSLSEDEIHLFICYFIGNKFYLNRKEADLQFVENSKKEKNSISDMFDYMAVHLMSRETTKDEANYLLQVFRSQKNENEALLKALEELKKFEDVKTK